MFRSIAIVLVIGSGVLAASCGKATPAPDVEAIRQTLDRMHVEHASAYVREDLDAVSAQSSGASRGLASSSPA